MKCRSVACIWSATPPSHRVTAAAVLHNPPSLFTGGSDGSLIWWTLRSSELVPIAMLCGHAAPIADVAICDPLAVSNNENRASPELESSSSALISACVDGMLCVWSRASGHCRRRRKLPPWVGSPFTMRKLPSNPRYVCIACCFVDTVNLSDHHHRRRESSEVLADKKPSSKCTVVIVDTYTLVIVQTVFHGNLMIASLKFMDVVSFREGEARNCVVMADSFGQVQMISLPNEPILDGERGSGASTSSQMESSVCGERLNEGGQVMSVATCENVIVFVLKNRCVFRLLPTGITIGEIFLADNNLVGEESKFTESHFVGGIFLKPDDAADQEVQEPDRVFSRTFAVWKYKGLSIVYAISYVRDSFKCERLCEIPASSYPHDVGLSFIFIQLSHYVLRIESVCVFAEEYIQWKPHVTIWSTCRNHDDHGKLCLSFELHGVGHSFVDWTENSLVTNQSEVMQTRVTTTPPLISSCRSSQSLHAEGDIGLVNKRGVVSSSMVISEILSVPYAVVYGFSCGEIEMVRFDLLEGLTSLGGSPRHEAKSHVSKQLFLGHTGAVLSLAAHKMVGVAKGWSFNQVLVSGSMDCTVRIWDIDTGNPITVMHQHVGPVRQLILPPARTYRPWCDCFLSVGEDSCVALCSLMTLRAERIFPGHPSYPAKVVWDSARGYIACLCRKSETIQEHLILLIFCTYRISMKSLSGSALNGNTSVSSLLLPVLEDGASTHSHVDHSLVTLSNLTPGKTADPNTPRDR